jgi:Methyltransferase domain
MHWTKELFEDWERCAEVSRKFSGHYSLIESQQMLVYWYAKQLPPGSVALEIGVCNGKTAAVLAYCAKAGGFEAHGIDAFILENSPGQIRATMTEAELPYNLHHGLSNAHTIGRGLEEVPWDRPVDLLLIDGNHNDPWVSADCAKWLPFLKSGSIALFHDYDAWENPKSPHASVRAAVERNTIGWMMAHYIGDGPMCGLIAKRKP